ncbi:DUF5819 family protein [Streptomyces alkaliterrae]|uniref:Uncharacterized protein n=1 Tax=Streptomyces alkaliterrae TaxID=2213162 RepID=A0A5P0YQM7_9ACTN|nr:DUF5819 family protein [Streptomyces alkaliterrae]MBB1255954.1 hypothetical protein [Streptomyces alkaliterrae]MBB1261985.1 hypothetical protein [Streptomyces alkaliterrae]MQS02220.1 hypothetical protein [Streptomyces alkaliterrae]
MQPNGDGRADDARGAHGAPDASDASDAHGTRGARAAAAADDAPAAGDGAAAAGDPATDGAARGPDGFLVLRPGGAVVLVGAVALLLAGILAHLGMVFLHVAPPNALSRQHGKAIDGWIYPEFEQNWKLFAPNPLQQNVSVHVRVETRDDSGALRRGAWVNLTAFDAENIRGNLVPSHTAQNELRRAWDFFTNSHDSENRPTGTRGELAEAYLKRIAMLRLTERRGVDAREVVRVQLRSATTPVQPPPWSGEQVDDTTRHRTLPWWPVTEADVPGAGR